MEGSYAYQWKGNVRMMKNSLSALEDSLVRKNDILRKLQPVLEKQCIILQKESMDLDEFDECVEAQDKLVEELNVLDAEFDCLYKDVKAELTNNREKYAVQIESLQRLNHEIQDLCSVLQQKEVQNKEMLMEHLQNEKMNFGAGRRSSKVAYGYYKSMSQSNVVPPQFMDKKK